MAYLMGDLRSSFSVAATSVFLQSSQRAILPKSLHFFATSSSLSAFVAEWPFLSVTSIFDRSADVTTVSSTLLQEATTEYPKQQAEVGIHV